jgi:glycosyltransferase involved in cell wall biosynthesis
MAISKRPRVLLLIPHLGGGGAERVIAHLANGLSPDKYDLHLGLITDSNPGPFELPHSVTVHCLAAARVRSSALRLLSLIHSLHPQLILSGMFHLNFLVLLLRPFLPRKTHVLIRQNGTVSSALAFGDTPAYTRTLYRLLYRHADRIICQASSMAKDLARTLSIPEEQITVVPNPIDIDAVRAAAGPVNKSFPAKCPHLLAIGRLSPVKGFDLLLDAMALVKPIYPGVRLTIVGSGPQETFLKTMCACLGLTNSVRFPGEVSRPASYFADASLFVLSSRHEGMPNALLEAAAAGLPLVAVPASGGIIDLLQNQEGTWLASDGTSAALAESLLAALQVLEPGKRFRHNFIEPFRIENSIHAYEELIDATLAPV